MTALQATSWRLAQPSHVAGAVSQGRSAGSLRLRGPCILSRPALRRSSRAVGPAPPPRAIEEVDLGFSADPEAETYFDDHTGFNLRREGGGYTPFEFITFSDEVLRHEVALRVDAPVSKCFQIWSDRFNWMQWCAEIEEMGFHEEDSSLVSMYLWYRWASTPFLELFVTLKRTECEENKHIMEEPVQGMPLVAAVLFEEVEPNATIVKLRISYQLPEVLKDFAGKLAVWSDVDRKLQLAMSRMRGFVESVDLQQLLAQRAEDWQMVEAGFPEQRRLAEEEQQAEAEAFQRAKRREREAATQAEAEASGALQLEEQQQQAGAAADLDALLAGQGWEEQQPSWEGGSSDAAEPAAVTPQAAAAEEEEGSPSGSESDGEGAAAEGKKGKGGAKKTRRGRPKKGAAGEEGA